MGAGGFGTDGSLVFVSGRAAELRTETDTWVQQDAHIHTCTRCERKQIVLIDQCSGGPTKGCVDEDEQEEQGPAYGSHA